MTYTVEALDELCKSIFDKRKEIDDKKEELKLLNNRLFVIQQSMMEALKELDRKNYQSPHGTVTVKERWRVNLPKTDADKEKLFGWLRDKGEEVFLRYATVNSNSLNSLYMSDWEAAKEAGEGMEFEVPGVERPTLFEDLGVRKK